MKPGAQTDSKIRVLSEQTINQIAAGEVIENPASVVKELVENAIDAGARHITIEILGGGFQKIRISDDGCGMSSDDAVLCVERHATSKIIQPEDLFSLTTMGFRGEALASIAAISKLDLFSALEDAAAVHVGVEGGTITHVESAARSRGTTMEVRSLFYNVPARKKFQKSPAASSAEITRTLTQLALAHPEVGLTLISQNHLQFSLPSSSGENFLTLLQKRSGALLGSSFLSSCRPLDFQGTGYQGKGLIAEPLFSRHNRSGQYLFVNRRPVVCPTISYAMRDAYGTRLSTDRHPVYLLHLTIAPDLVDINVHPQKKEIRLREERLLKYALHDAVNEALVTAASHCVPPSLEKNTLSSQFSSSVPFDFTEPLLFREEREPLHSAHPELPIENPLRIIGIFGKYLLVDAASIPQILFSEKEREHSGVVWIDLPTAESRIQFDTLLRNAEKTPASQGLLIPVSFSFSKAEAHLLGIHLETVQKLGMQIREVGNAAFLVEGIPPSMKEDEIYPTLIEIIGALQEQGSEKKRSLCALRKLSALVSRRIKTSGAFYTADGARRIVELLWKSEDPLHCPQGKPTIHHIRENEIEAWFTSKSTLLRPT